MSPTVYCLFSSRINFSCNDKLIATSWLLGGAQRGTTKHEDEYPEKGGWQTCAFTHFAILWTFSPLSKPGHCHSNELPVTACITCKTNTWSRPTYCQCKLLCVKTHQLPRGSCLWLQCYKYTSTLLSSPTVKLICKYCAFSSSLLIHSGSPRLHFR